MTENEQEAPPAPPRVPNVSHGAVSGLDHEVIGAAAQEVHDAQYGALSDEPGLEVPEGDLESRVLWVADSEDQAERSDRADAVYAHEKDSGADEAALADLGAKLTAAVYGDGGGNGEPDEELVIPDEVADTVTDRLAWVHAAEDSTEMVARANAVLVAEAERDEQRTTLVEPLEALLAKQAAPAEDDGAQ